MSDPVDRPAGMFHDILTGNNDAASNLGGARSAAPGRDLTPAGAPREGRLPFRCGGKRQVKGFAQHSRLGPRSKEL